MGDQQQSQQALLLRWAKFDQVLARRPAQWPENLEPHGQPPTHDATEPDRHMARQ